MKNRWWIYQKQRFPVATHGLLIAVFSYCVVNYSTLVRGMSAHAETSAYIVAFVTVFLMFFQMRIADEFKDYEDDRRYRPYRPVPSGLVRLTELARIGWLGAAVQFALALWLSPLLLIPLAAVWVYLGLMTREFFCVRWLRARPVAYMASHMLILPLITLYASACDWIPSGAAPSIDLLPLLATSFCTGLVLEVGRKIRALESEEPGVETYSHLWGHRRAVYAWWSTILAAVVCGWLVASEIQFPMLAAVILAGIALNGFLVGLGFLNKPIPARAHLLQSMSNLSVLAIYLAIGALPYAPEIRGLSS